VAVHSKPASSVNSSNELTFRPARGASADHIEHPLGPQASSTSTASISNRGCTLRRSVSSGAAGSGLKGRLNALDLSRVTGTQDDARVDVESSDAQLLNAASGCSTPGRRNTGMPHPSFVCQDVYTIDVLPLTCRGISSHPSEIVVRGSTLLISAYIGNLCYTHAPHLRELQWLL
jgi:hypothetical protein